jgi:hypothetical protein
MDYHGGYFRKATHCINIRIQVLRLKCKVCPHSVIVLPGGFFPYCRWPLEFMLQVLSLKNSGKSKYSIAKLMDESLYSITKLFIWLSDYMALIAPYILTDESFHKHPPRPKPSTPTDFLQILHIFPSWRYFTFIFSRLFYPKRFSFLSSHTILNL